MIGLLLLAAAVPAERILPEAAAIVAPFAACRFKHQAKLDAAQEQWLAAEHRKYADPSNTASAAQSESLLQGVIALKGKIAGECGEATIHAHLSRKFREIFPEIDSVEMYNLERSVFSQLDHLNELLVMAQAGILPRLTVRPPPPPPPAPPAPQR